MAVAYGLTLFQFAGTAAQARKTHRLKNASDVSALMTLLFYAALLFSLPYAYGAHFPLPYLIGFSAQTILVSFMSYQIYLYRDDIDKQKFVATFVFITITGALFSLFTYYNIPVGTELTGWICISLFSVRSIPQIIRIFKTKSVEGRSFFDIALDVIAPVINIALGIHFALPIHIMLNYLRLLTVGIIQLVQVALYKK